MIVLKLTVNMIRTKKQYIWRFHLDDKDVTIELFASKLSGKKKVIVNGQLKAEMQK